MKKVSSLSSSYECMDEIPYHRIRANQLGILIFVIVTLLTSWYGLLLIPLVVQIISRQFGIQYNLFVRLIAPLLPESPKNESRELLRFNNLLAIFFLSGTIIAFLFNAAIVAYIFIGMLSAAII